MMLITYDKTNGNFEPFVSATDLKDKIITTIRSIKGLENYTSRPKEIVFNTEDHFFYYYDGKQYIRTVNYL